MTSGGLRVTGTKQSFSLRSRVASEGWPPSLSHSVDLGFFDQSSDTRGYYQCRLIPAVHKEWHEGGGWINCLTPKAKFQEFFRPFGHPM